jgi:hypothetical protein
MLTDKEELNQNAENKYITSVLGLNIPLKSPLDALHKKLGSKFLGF